MAFPVTLDPFPFDQVPSRDLLPVDELSGPDQDYYLGGGGGAPGEDRGWYPVEISEDKMHEWMWRVRKWRVVASGHISCVTEVENEFPPPDLFATVTTEGDFSIDQIITPPVIAPWNSATAYLALNRTIVTHAGGWWHPLANSTNQEPGPGSAYWRLLGGASSDVEAEEMALVSANQRPLWGYAEETISEGLTETEQMHADPPPDPAPTVTNPDAITGVSLDFTYASQFTYIPRWKRNGDLFLPRLMISIVLSGGYVPNIISLTSAHQEDPDPDSINTYVYHDITLDGHTISMQRPSVVDEPGFALSTLGLTGFSCAITPYEWYPMDPSDGLGPVYDTATGERTARALPNP